MNTNSKKLMGAALALGLAANSAQAIQAPDASNIGAAAFIAISEISSATDVLAHGGEHKCGEGKCGKEHKCGEGKCGKEHKCGEGKCGAAKPAAKTTTKAKTTKDAEHKCGEGKCGGHKH